MGGMQVLEWGVMYPERVGALVPIATAAAASAQQIGWWSSGRRCIRMDPRWRGGEYYDAEAGDGPHDGLATARMISMMTFRSDDVFSARFGREVGRAGRGLLAVAALPGRALPRVPGRQARAAVRRQQLPAADQGDGPARPRPGPGRARGGVRPAAGARCCRSGSTATSSTRPTSPARSSSVARRAGRRRRLRRDGQPARPRRVPDRERPARHAPPPLHRPTGGRPVPDDTPTAPGSAARLAPRHPRHPGRAAVQPRLAGARAVPVDHLRGGLGRRPPAHGRARLGPATTTPASAAPRCRSSRRPWPTSRAPRRRWRRARAWRRSPAWCSACARRATTSWCSASSSRSRAASSPPTCPASASTSRSSTAPTRSSSSTPCGRAAPSSCSSRPPPTRPCRSPTSRRSRRSRARSPWSTRRSPRPMVQQPLALGADLVLHAATKGLAGHNDALLGVVAGSRDLIDAVWGWHVVQGGQASPFDAWNGLRGIRTLGVRVRQQSRDGPGAGRAPRDAPGGDRRSATPGSTRTPSVTWPSARCRRGARWSRSSWPAGSRPPGGSASRPRSPASRSRSAGPRRWSPIPRRSPAT